MKTTKKLLASVVAASVASMAGVAHADIELGEGLAVTGFVDMSYLYVDVDGADSTSKDFQIDQVETDFLYTGKDGVSAQVDIEYSRDQTVDVDTGESTTFIEQAFITKDFGNGLSVKGGRFLSYSGWETEEPTGLYQYSGTGYGAFFYGGYQQGVSAYYDTDSVDLMFSVVNSAFDPNDSDTTNLAMEAGVAVTPMEGLTAKLFYISDDETDIVNFWTSYETGDLTLAFEFNTADYGDDSDGDGFLLMANYAFDKLGLTVRYHDFTIEEGAVATDKSAITIAPNYAVADNLLMVLEVRMDEETVGGGDSVDTTSVAVEALFTF